MTKFWCVNFDSEDCLRHGIHRKLWMMQYQYADDQGHVFQDGRQRSATTRNWRRMKEIDAGDRFVAYLPGNRFYAVGTVIRPRMAKSSDNSIEEYVARKRSHEHETGRVYYTPVFYEDFTDNWRHPGDPLMRYAQRIDVDEWQHYVPHGVVEKGLNKIKRPELQMAAIRITKGYFNRIEKRLAAKHGSFSKKQQAPGVDESVVDAVEQSQAKSQGFLLDSTLRKILERYAMDTAKQHFSTQGYKWEDCSKTCSYDLRCSRGQEVLYVEVKGTQTDGSEIILTQGEVEFALGHKGQMVLFVLHSIHVVQGRNGVVPGGGVRHLVQPWDVDDGKLMPVSFKYAVPAGPT
jgi:hypothetical protein